MRNRPEQWGLTMIIIGIILTSKWVFAETDKISANQKIVRLKQPPLVNSISDYLLQPYLFQLYRLQ